MTRAYDAISGEDLTFSVGKDGRIEVTVPSLGIHRAVVLESAS